jgi:hypothetical protein
MDGEGKPLGWAFGEELRRDEPGYLEGLRRGALKEAEEDAGRKGVRVRLGSAKYITLTQQGFPAPDEDGGVRLIVRCLVSVIGPHADQLRVEGPMNGL